MPRTREIAHESVGRLLAFAVEATRSWPDSRRVTSLATLQAAFPDLSAQTFSNWKTRGVSVGGAIEAEQLFGCPAVYVLNGKMPPLWPRPKLSARIATRLDKLSPAELARVEAVLDAHLGPEVDQSKRPALVA